jgi:adenine-specific DNA-methyltransferase
VTGTLVQRTEGRRRHALAALDPADQARYGQFFTPERAADLVASMPRLPDSGTLRVLDPGAGSGSLAAALVQRVITESPEVNMELVAVEIDPSVEGYLRATLEDCQAAADDAGMTLKTRLVVGDFLDLSNTHLGADDVLSQSFDIVIMNPPYAKLSLASKARAALKQHGVDCPNIYAAFLALGAAALVPDGQLVAITPRSFANGPYFEQFRKYLLNTVAIDRLHTFESRSTVFADTGVLQENIVLSASRGAEGSKVRLTVSSGHTDEAVEHLVDYAEIVAPGDPHQFLASRLAKPTVRSHASWRPCQPHSVTPASRHRRGESSTSAPVIV